MLPRDWLYVIPNYENYILYAPLHRKSVRITTDAARGIIPILDGAHPQNILESEIWSFLTEHGLLVPLVASEMINHDRRRKSNKIYLSITNKCNLRCIYCYASSGVSSSTMPFETAKKAIDYQLTETINSGGKTLAVTFHGGGEALVELDLLEQIVAYINTFARNNGVEPRLGCVTNATLITQNVAKWLAENFSHVTVSLDGSKEIQDSQRPGVAQSGSYDKAMCGIQNLIEEKVKFSIRATVTGLSVGKMGHFVRFIKESIFPNGGSVDFEPVSFYGRAKNNEVLAIPANDFLENYLIARNVGQQTGIDVTCSMDTFGSTKENYCGASQASLQCYTPDGLISACTRVTKNSDDGADLFFYGEIDSHRLNFYPEARDKVVSFGSNYLDKCYQCFARWNCQGGCSISRYKDHEHFEQACLVTKSLLLHDLKNALECFQ